MPIKSFTPTEIGILSTAFGLWLDSSLEDIALGAVRRVNSTALLDPALEINSLRTLNFSAEGLLDVTPGRIQEALAEGAIAIVAGFQGVAQDTKDITTLGRGGSDTTAVALAAALDADVCEIY